MNFRVGEALMPNLNIIWRDLSRFLSSLVGKFTSKTIWFLGSDLTSHKHDNWTLIYWHDGMLLRKHWFLYTSQPNMVLMKCVLVLRLQMLHLSVYSNTAYSMVQLVFQQPLQIQRCRKFKLKDHFGYPKSTVLQSVERMKHIASPDV